MFKLIISFIFIAILSLFPSSSILATTTPTLISPINNSTTNTSPTFNWEIVPEAVQYRIIVDDESTLTSPYIKNYYTTNNYYSPTINPGLYYWKVEAKDVANVWSPWSDIWSFTYDDTQPTPIPTEIPAPTPTEAPTPTPTEEPTPTPTDIPTPTPTEEIPSPTPTPTEILSPTPTETPIPTETPTPTPIESGPTPTETPYPTITVSPTPTISPKPSFTCHLISKPIKFMWFKFYLPLISCSLK